MRLGKRQLNGQTLVMFCLVSAVLVMVMGLAIDASGAWWKSQRQTDAQEVAKEAVISRANEIKFDSSDSTAAAARIAYQAIQENLPDASALDLEVWAWEVPKSESGYKDRLIGIEVISTSKYECAFASTFGFKTIPVKSHIEFTVNPYSSTTVWRQSDDGHGYLIKQESGKRATESALSSSETLPDQLNQALSKGLTELS